MTTKTHTQFPSTIRKGGTFIGRVEVQGRVICPNRSNSCSTLWQRNVLIKGGRVGSPRHDHDPLHMFSYSESGLLTWRVDFSHNIESVFSDLPSCGHCMFSTRPSVRLTLSGFVRVVSYVMAVSVSSVSQLVGPKGQLHPRTSNAGIDL